MDSYQTSALELLQNTPKELRLQKVKAYLRTQEELIEKKHLQGGSGLHIAHKRSLLIDGLLRATYSIECEACPELSNIALIANGGYGRGYLNPGSDIDLSFILPVASHKITAELSAAIQNILYLLWDTGFKVGHSSRSITECIQEGRKDPITRTALFDARLLAGSHSLFEQFQKKYRQECIIKDSQTFFKERYDELKKRHHKYSNTIFLQEPNVKESPGGMRDFHNLLWIADSELDTRSLEDLVEKEILSQKAAQNLTEGFDFLHRIRNSIHYHTQKPTDILTLHLQGVLADALEYPQMDILRRIEALMKDYYRHTRNIHQHTTSVYQRFSIELEDKQSSLPSWLPFSGRKKDTLTIGNFYSRNGFVYPNHPNAFIEHNSDILRMFHVCQVHDLKMSPEIRRLLKASWPSMDQYFRERKTNRETFRAILENKGSVGRSLRQMHRVGVLGRYLPEFGALDCLVQHEFFHRYTADEHTLRTIEQLDLLHGDDRPERALYREIFIKHPDPYALYLSLIMHDTGRAENVREHTDGSAELSAEVCKRLRIKGRRRSLIMFLVDHHLTLWRFATKRDISDPDVIEEFMSLMQNKENLKSLLIFTLVDSNGTNEEAWSTWKESLILQLYHSTLERFEKGKEEFDLAEQALIAEQFEALKKHTKPEEHGDLVDHFTGMPKRYFRYRAQHNLAIHFRTLQRYREKHAQNPDTPFKSAEHWIVHEERGYTELIVASSDRSQLLETITCALASQDLSIISADIFTREDGIALDLLRVCHSDLTPVKDRKIQKKVIETLYAINQDPLYDPEKYLVKKKNYLASNENYEGKIPVRAYFNDELDPLYNVLEVQAVDRIGLLYDLLKFFHEQHFSISHARICTEKGAALDTFYLHQNGKKCSEQEQLIAIENGLNKLLNQ